MADPSKNNTDNKDTGKILLSLTEEQKKRLLKKKLIDESDVIDMGTGEDGQKYFATIPGDKEEKVFIALGCKAPESSKIKEDKKELERVNKLIGEMEGNKRVPLLMKKKELENKQKDLVNKQKELENKQKDLVKALGLSKDNSSRIVRLARQKIRDIVGVKEEIKKKLLGDGGELEERVGFKEAPELRPNDNMMDKEIGKFKEEMGKFEEEIGKFEEEKNKIIEEKSKIIEEKSKIIEELEIKNLLATEEQKKNDNELMKKLKELKEQQKKLEKQIKEETEKADNEAIRKTAICSLKDKKQKESEEINVVIDKQTKTKCCGNINDLIDEKKERKQRLEEQINRLSKGAVDDNGKELQKDLENEINEQKKFSERMLSESDFKNNPEILEKFMENFGGFVSDNEVEDEDGNVVARSGKPFSMKLFENCNEKIKCIYIGKVDVGHIRQEYKYLYVIAPEDREKFAKLKDGGLRLIGGVSSADGIKPRTEAETKKLEKINYVRKMLAAKLNKDNKKDDANNAGNTNNTTNNTNATFLPPYLKRSGI